MSNTLKLRGGTTAEVAAATLAEREIMVDTTKDVIVVGPTKKEMAVGNGGTYTGNYTFSGDVTISGAATFGSSFNANSLRIQNVATPTGNSDASNKSYVDGLITTVQNTTLPGNVFSADSTITITDNNPGVGDVDLSISNNSVSTAKIQDNAVTTAKFADGSVTSLKFGSASVTTAKIADQAVTTAKLEVSAVTSNRIAAGAVGSTKIADNGISAIKLQSGSVTTDKLQDDAVTTAKINASAVGTTELADDAVTTAKIADANITTALIANNAVTAAKIDNTVLTTHAAQVTAAAASATAAATSATNAGTSETNAATSATASTTQATASANSATAAASSAASALAAFDNFDDTYLGAKASDPSTDNDGDPLTAGDLYFNTTTDVMKLYTGSSWVTAYVPGDAANITNAASGNLTSTNVQSSLQELQTDIDSTVSATTTNATNIASNDTDIATNVTNIATNATNIASNDTDIATNVTNIATNVTNIATNATNIATNVTNIAARLPLAGGTMTGDIVFNSGQTIAGYTPRTSATGSSNLSVGTTAQRDGSPAAGMIRYNSTLGQFEGYGSAWGAIGGSGGGGAITTTASGSSDTVQTSTTSTSTLSGSQNQPSFQSWDLSGNNFTFSNDDSDSNYSAFLAGVALLPSGASLTLNGSGAAVAYTISGTSHQSWTSGNLSIVFVQSDYWNLNGFPPFGTGGVASYSHSNIVRAITGSNNPIFDTAVGAVKINGVGYNTSDWTVSGSTATHKSSNPSISVGDAIEQVDSVHNIGSYGDTKNSLTLHGEDSVFQITDGSSSSALALSGITTPKLTANGGNGLILEASGDRNIYLTVEGSTYNAANSRSVFLGNEIATNRLNQTHYRCVAIGYRALKGISGSSGQISDNIAIGDEAMLNITSSSDGNIAIGDDAMRGSNSGISGAVRNVGIGQGALKVISSGDRNVVVGSTAGYFITTGSRNILLGYLAGSSTSPSGVLSSHNDTICLGDNNITNAYIKVSWTVTSDQRDKTDIFDFAEGLDFVKALRPVTFKWDERSKYLPEVDSEDPDFVMPGINEMTPNGTHKGTKTEVGFLAQEVRAVENQFGWANSEDDALVSRLTPDQQSMGLQHESLIPMLVNAIKELSDKNDALEARIAALEAS